MVIAVSIPTFESVLPETFKSLWEMDRCGHEVRFDFVRGYDCAHARNEIARRAIGSGADAVLMVDGDIVVPGGALGHLLSWDEPVVLGYYARNGRKDGATCLFKKGGANYDSCFSAFEMRSARQMRSYKVEAKGGGLGCALIRTSVFGSIAYPFFKWEDHPDGSCLSEDLYFCEQLAVARVPIYADARVACGHVTRSRKDV